MASSPSLQFHLEYWTPHLEMISLPSPSTSEATIDRKVGPVTTRPDIETVALPGVLEVERLTKSVMYIFLQSCFSKGKKIIMANHYLFTLLN